MYNNKFTQFKKYVTYMFVVFTVFAGVAKEYNTYEVLETLSINNSTILYMLKINQIISKNIGITKICSFINKNLKPNNTDILLTKKAFLKLIIINMFVFGCLFFVVYINNNIKKNNIWKNAVF